jgi:hypothetical protein
MKKLTLWMMAAILSCSPLVFTSCLPEDNPVVNPPKEEKNADRAVFEKVLSERLAKSAQDIRFESAMESTKALTDFLSALEEDALKDQISTFLTKVVQGGQIVQMSSLSAQDKAAVEKCLTDRFNMTADELASTTFFIQLDAYKTLNKLHLTFENGICTSSEDAEGFTVEVVKSTTERSKFQILFSEDDEEGSCFFPTRVGGVVPVALRLPKSFNVSLTTMRGTVMNGVIDLSSKATSSYVSIKSDDWTVGTMLIATVFGREEAITARLNHGEDGMYEAEASIYINDKAMIAFEARGLKAEYTDEYIDSDELKQLREMGPFFAAGYEVLKALKGKTIDELSITLEEDLVISGSIDDAAKTLLALGHIRQLYGTQPGFEAVDAYTQELNKHIHFTVYQVSSDITAEGSLLTIQKGSKNEYQPGLALLFNGEKEAQSMYENMSEEDLANYNKIVGNFNVLLKECTTLVENFSAKIKTIADAFKL